MEIQNWAEGNQNQNRLRNDFVFKLQHDVELTKIVFKNMRFLFLSILLLR